MLWWGFGGRLRPVCVGLNAERGVEHWWGPGISAGKVDRADVKDDVAEDLSKLENVFGAGEVEAIFAGVSSVPEASDVIDVCARGYPAGFDRFLVRGVVGGCCPGIGRVPVLVEVLKASTCHEGHVFVRGPGVHDVLDSAAVGR